MSGQTSTTITFSFGRVGRPRLRLIHRKTQSSNIYRGRAFIRGRSVASRWGFQNRRTLVPREVHAYYPRSRATARRSSSTSTQAVRPRVAGIITLADIAYLPLMRCRQLLMTWFVTARQPAGVLLCAWTSSPTLNFSGSHNLFWLVDLPKHQN